MGKTSATIILAVSLFGIAGSAAAHSQFGVGISLGIPAPVYVAPPPPPVAYYPRPVYVTPPPLVYAPPPPAYYGPSYYGPTYYGPPRAYYPPAVVYRTHPHRGWSRHRW